MLSSKNLERVDGIEPTSSAWKAAALPLCYTRAETAEVLGERRSRFLSVVLIRRVRRRRVVGEEGLEPSKLTQGIYSPPPLPLGTFPQRALSNRRTPPFRP